MPLRRTIIRSLVAPPCLRWPHQRVAEPSRQPVRTCCPSRVGRRRRLARRSASLSKAGAAAGHRNRPAPWTMRAGAAQSAPDGDTLIWSHGLREPVSPSCSHLKDLPRSRSPIRRSQSSCPKNIQCKNRKLMAAPARNLNHYVLQGGPPSSHSPSSFSHWPRSRSRRSPTGGPLPHRRDICEIPSASLRCRRCRPDRRQRRWRALAVRRRRAQRHA